MDQVLLGRSDVPLHFGELVAQLGIIRQHNVVGPEGIVRGCLLHEQVSELVRRFHRAAHSLNYKYDLLSISSDMLRRCQAKYTNNLIENW